MLVTTGDVSVDVWLCCVDSGFMSTCFLAGVDHFRSPKLVRCIQCSVERLVVRLGPSLDKFEEDLSLMVQNEHMQRQMTLIGGGRTAQVIRRYLRVQLALCRLLALASSLKCCELESIWNHLFENAGISVIHFRHIVAGTWLHVAGRSNSLVYMQIYSTHSI